MDFSEPAVRAWVQDFLFPGEGFQDQGSACEFKSLNFFFDNAEGCVKGPVVFQKPAVFEMKHRAVSTMGFGNFFGCELKGKDRGRRGQRKSFGIRLAITVAEVGDLGARGVIPGGKVKAVFVVAENAGVPGRIAGDFPNDPGVDEKTLAQAADRALMGVAQMVVGGKPEFHLGISREDFLKTFGFPCVIEEGVGGFDMGIDEDAESGAQYRHVAKDKGRSAGIF